MSSFEKGLLSECRFLWQFVLVLDCKFLNSLISSNANSNEKFGVSSPFQLCFPE